MNNLQLLLLIILFLVIIYHYIEYQHFYNFNIFSKYLFINSLKTYDFTNKYLLNI